MRGQGKRSAGWCRRSAGVMLGAFAMLAAAPAAQAADTFVNGATGNNSSACTSAALPCATVQAAITKAGSNSTITVAPGAYTGLINIGDGNSLRASGSLAATTLEVVYVDTAAGTIEGFTFVGNAGIDANYSMRVADSATVAGNVFDVDDSVGAALGIEYNSESPTVRDNRFIDDGAGANTAITVNPVGSEAPVVSGNEISGFAAGIRITRGAAVVRGNVISGTHNNAGQGTAIAVSLGGATPGDDDATPTIVGNVLRDPVPFNDINGPYGISVIQGTNGNPTLSATLRRNTVRGFGMGVRAINTDTFTLDGDLITGGGYGLTSIDTAPGLGNVAATNITSWGNSFDINLQNTDLTLNSSIVEDPIRTIDSGANPFSCAITFSRGPTTSGINPCFEFQTTVSPQFVDAAAGNFHLLPGSLLIDAGDPAFAHVEPLDFDGDARATAKVCGEPRSPTSAPMSTRPTVLRPRRQSTLGPRRGAPRSRPRPSSPSRAPKAGPVSSAHWTQVRMQRARLRWRSRRSTSGHTSSRSARSTAPATSTRRRRRARGPFRSRLRRFLLRLRQIPRLRRPRSSKRRPRARRSSSPSRPTRRRDSNASSTASRSRPAPRPGATSACPTVATSSRCGRSTAPGIPIRARPWTGSASVAR